MTSIEAYYNRIMSAGNLDNPSMEEAAKDLTRAYTFIFIG